MTTVCKALSTHRMISLRQPVEYSSTATKKCINSVFRGCGRKANTGKTPDQAEQGSGQPQGSAGRHLWVTAHVKVTRHPGSSFSSPVTSSTAFCLTGLELFKEMRIASLECPALAPALMDELWVGKSLQGSEIDYGLHSCLWGCLRQVKNNHPFPRAPGPAAAALFVGHEGEILL